MARDRVSLHRLQQIAFGTAQMAGLVAPTREEIAKMYYSTGSKALPIARLCKGGYIWVDKFYVAYQVGTGDVLYTYISRTHILEEVASYREAAKARDEQIELAPDILQAYKVAGDYMKEKHVRIWITPRFRKNKKNQLPEKSEHK